MKSFKEFIEETKVIGGRKPLQGGLQLLGKEVQKRTAAKLTQTDPQPTKVTEDLDEAGAVGRMAARGLLVGALAAGVSQLDKVPQPEVEVRGKTHKVMNQRPSESHRDSETVVTDKNGKKYYRYEGNLVFPVSDSDK